jgi:hypothetical protein
MAKFLTAQKASAAIEDIATKADKELVLISPYVKIPDPLMQRFKYLDEKNIKITLVCREANLKAEERTRLSDIEHLELRFLDNLHAKCFYNQESMVIGSLNLYESSLGDNHEMGVLLTLREDQDVFVDARKEADFIIKTAEIVTIVSKQNIRASNVDVNDRRKILKTKEKVQNSPAVGFLKEIGKALGLSEQKGYCIRGGEEIPYNVDRPLCRQHFGVWKEHEDPDYKEHYCHRCGERHWTSFSRPLCLSCFKNE